MERDSEATAATTNSVSAIDGDVPLVQVRHYHTSFVGRSDELTELGRLLGITRLLTVTGVAGVGKSRFAARAAEMQTAEFPDGVYTVSLTDIDDPRLVIRAVAQALLGMAPEGPDSFVGDIDRRPQIEAINDVIGTKKQLIIFDDCEFTTDSVGELAQAILDSCSNVHVMAVSRTALNVAGETVWTLHPLSVPVTMDEHPDPEEIADAEAVALFVDRARKVKPDFNLDRTSAPLVAQVCQKLEGLPLAIELAAARTGVLSLDEILRRLSDQFSLFTEPGKDHGRRETLEATVSWSYELAHPDEQRLFERLSVFLGGFDLRGAEQVARGVDLRKLELIDLLHGLVDKSMIEVQYDVRGLARYRIQETLRQYGERKLRESGDYEPTKQRHLGYHLDMAEDLYRDVTGPTQAEILTRFDTERENFRTALDWAIERNDAEAAMRFLGNLYWFWFVRRHEGAHDLARRILDVSGAIAEPTLARAWLGMGLLAGIAGHMTEAGSYLAKSIDLHEELDDPGAIAEAEMYLGLIAQEAGDEDGAESRFEKSLTLYQGTDLPWGVGWSRWFLGLTCRNRGNFEAATALIDQALTSFRQIRDPFGTANCVALLGTLARQRGDAIRALALHREALGMFRELGDIRSVGSMTAAIGVDSRDRGDLATAVADLELAVAITEKTGDRSGKAKALGLLGDSLRMKGDYALARTALLRSLGIMQDLAACSTRSGACRTLEGVAHLDHELGRHERAAYLFGLAESEDAVVSPGRRTERRNLESGLLAALGGDQYEAAKASGRAMSVDEAISFALAEIEGFSNPSFGALTIDQIELGERVTSQLFGISDRRELKLAGIRLSGRRRRPSGEREPLDRQLRTSGRLWVAFGVGVIVIWIGLFAFPATTEWWTRIDLSLSEKLVDLRTTAMTEAMRTLHALGSAWFFRPIRWATLLILVFFKRWRHLAAALMVFLLVNSTVDTMSINIARPRPLVPIIGDWTGYSHPSAPVAFLAATLAVAGYSLLPAGLWRKRAMWGTMGLLLLLVSARVYLGVDHLSDAAVGAMVGASAAVIIFKLFSPEPVFPVSYRRGVTAHLDIEGPRGKAIRKAAHDQLGLEVLDMELFGTESSGGSTPIRMRVAGNPDTHLFAKLYSTGHLRADRWYKVGRTILYGSLEDEVRFTSVRRLVEYEDYLLLTMTNAGVPSPKPFGIIEITAEREYLIVTEFLEGAVEISKAEIDDSLIDDALLLIRRLWDAGLAHRDIKPANVMVQEDKVRLVDVAFAMIRPSPWRQAVDLANMMIILGLLTDPDRVYRRALRFFAPEDIAEGFAATHGVTIPSQSRSSLKVYQRTHNRDLIEAFRKLAPQREPIAIQRWNSRRIGLTLGALLVAVLAISIVIENIMGGGFL